MQWLRVSQKLKDKLDFHEKKLFVAVPADSPQSSSSIDGYDYRTIGELAVKYTDGS